MKIRYHEFLFFFLFLSAFIAKGREGLPVLLKTEKRIEKLSTGSVVHRRRSAAGGGGDIGQVGNVGRVGQGGKRGKVHVGRGLRLITRSSSSDTPKELGNNSFMFQVIYEQVHCEVGLHIHL